MSARRGSYWAFLATLFGSLIPTLFLYGYHRQFGYDPFIVVFGQIAVLLALALIGLASLAAGAHRPSGRNGISARLFATGTALLAGVVAFVYVGTYLSNAIWGDTLTYDIVTTFASQGSVLVDFLPVSPSKKAALLAGLLGASAALLLLVMFVVKTIALRLATTVGYWLADSNLGRRRFIRLSVTLATTIVAAAGFCIAAALVQPQLLEGEPMTAFFKVVPAAIALNADNDRFSAAVEDRTDRASYKISARFAPMNVIVIFADALRADRMGVYGYHRPTTPFLSGLLAKNRLHRVDMALSTCSETFCGVASTFSSRPFHQVSRHNFKLYSLLRDIGYRVNFFLTGDHRSWRYLFNYYGSDVDELYDFRTLAAKDMHDDGNLIEALEKLDPAGRQPNFFYFFLMSSHILGRRLPEFDRYQPSNTDFWHVISFWNELAGNRRLQRVVDGQQLGSAELDAVSNRYDNGVLQTDFYIARIFAILDAKGYLDNSIVVILGDHGDGLGEHGHVGHTRYLFQEDIRIPFLVHERDITRYQNDAFASQIDVAPTIVERMGLQIPQTWQGQSLLHPPKDRMTLHQTRRGLSPCRALVEKSGASLIKYIRCGPAGADEMLFDLVADPLEQTNLAPHASETQLSRYRHELDRRIILGTNRCSGLECRD